MIDERWTAIFIWYILLLKLQLHLRIRVKIGNISCILWFANIFLQDSFGLVLSLFLSRSPSLFIFIFFSFFIYFCLCLAVSNTFMGGIHRNDVQREGGKASEHYLYTKCVCACVNMMLLLLNEPKSQIKSHKTGRKRKHCSWFSSLHSLTRSHTHCGYIKRERERKKRQCFQIIIIIIYIDI